MLVRIKDKGQVTIPSGVRKQVSAAIGDVFEVAVIDGNIVLKPRQVVSRSPVTSLGKPVDVSRSIGKGAGQFASPADVDAFIKSEREKWV
jgi:AbrB family looped-hinge helix DNA binding protein